MGNGNTKPKFGYNVIKVQPGSPGDIAGLCALFDFIIKANDVVLDKDNDEFTTILKNHLDKAVSLVVYNSKQDAVRNLSIIPSATWGGKGLLGISIRFCSLQGATEYVWHVLEVLPNSPAEAAGLQAYKDYIVGTPDIVFNDSEDFFALIEANIDKMVQLYIYNLDSDGIRVVSLTPSKTWGGSGSLGCGVGYGYLHRIPHNREAALQLFSDDKHPRPAHQLPPAADLEGAPEENGIPSSRVAERTTPTSPSKPLLLVEMPLKPLSPPSSSSTTTMPHSTQSFPSSPFITPLPTTPLTTTTPPSSSTPPTSWSSRASSVSSPSATFSTATPLSSVRPHNGVSQSPYSFTASQTTATTASPFITTLPTTSTTATTPTATTLTTPTSTATTPAPTSLPLHAYSLPSGYSFSPITTKVASPPPSYTSSSPSASLQPQVTYSPYSPFGGASSAMPSTPIHTPTLSATPAKQLFTAPTTPTTPSHSVSGLSDTFTNISLDENSKS